MSRTYSIDVNGREVTLDASDTVVCVEGEHFLLRTTGGESYRDAVLIEREDVTFVGGTLVVIDEDKGDALVAEATPMTNPTLTRVRTLVVDGSATAVLNEFHEPPHELAERHLAVALKRNDGTVLLTHPRDGRDEEHPSVEAAVDSLARGRLFHTTFAALSHGGPMGRG
jgi:hypothetical protein